MYLQLLLVAFSPLLQESCFYHSSSHLILSCHLFFMCPPNSSIIPPKSCATTGSPSELAWANVCSWRSLSLSHHRHLWNLLIHWWAQSGGRIRFPGTHVKSWYTNQIANWYKFSESYCFVHSNSLETSSLMHPSQSCQQF